MHCARFTFSVFLDLRYSWLLTMKRVYAVYMHLYSIKPLLIDDQIISWKHGDSIAMGQITPSHKPSLGQYMTISTDIHEWYHTWWRVLTNGGLWKNIVRANTSRWIYYIILYYIILYYIVLYCIVLYCIVLYCIVLYCMVLYCVVSCRVVSCRVASRRIASHRITSHHIILYYIIFNFILSYHIILYHIIS